MMERSPESRPQVVYRPGGLMRCCLATLDEMPSAPYAREGDTHRCKYCGAGMRFRAGAWEWEQPKP